MRSGRVPVIAALTALIVAMVASFTFASSPPGSPRGAAAAAHFLAAWDRKLHASFVVESTLTRKPATGGTLQVSTRLVQRPPDRLVIGLGSVEGQVGGRIVRCGPVVAQSCSAPVAAVDYEQLAAGELSTLRSYVEGPTPLYDVVDFDDARCFRLTLARKLPAAPYGDEALFCFDRATGAPATTVIRRGQGTERTDATAVRGEVTDADLVVPDDKGTAVVIDPSTTTSSPAATTSPTRSPPG